MSGTASFQTFSPAYENLSNRMSRLRHNSQNHHKSYTLSSSPPKPLNLFTIDTNITTKQNRRVSPTTFNLTGETGGMGVGKFTGRVTKNVGLKKYNQRQIKEVMNNRQNTHIRAKSHLGGGIRVCTENDTPCESRRLDRWAVAGAAGIDEVKMTQNASLKQSFKDNKYSNWQDKLVPGKMYKREYLCELMKTDHR